MWLSVVSVVLGLAGGMLLYFGPGRLYGLGLSTTYDELPFRGLVIGVGWTLIMIAAGLQVIAIIR